MVEKLPGVTLELTSCVRRKKIVEVALRGIIDNEEIWREVEKKLSEGLRLYSIDDFKTEILNAVRSELEEAESTIRILESAVQQLAYEKQLLENKLRRLEKTVLTVCSALSNAAPHDGR